MEGSVVPGLMSSMLWSGPSTKDIYKTAEDSGSSFEEAEDANNIILIIAVSIEGITLARDGLIYLLQGLRFVINIEKLVLQPCQNLEFLRGRNDLVLPDERKIKMVEQCQFLLK